MRPSQADVNLYRAALRDVNTLAQRDLLRTWRSLDLSNVNDVRSGLLDTVPDVVDGYHLMASTVAGDWYDLQRAKAGAAKRFQAVMPPQPTKTRSEILVRWGVGPYFASQAPEVAAPLVLSKVAGGLQRLVFSGARDTVLGSAARDLASGRYGRATDGNACEFCTLLATRTNYLSESTASFDTHDKCGCQPVPYFD